LIKEEEDLRPVFTDVFVVDEVINFVYSRKENQYSVQQRLNSIIGNERGAVITDNAITLHSMGLFHNPKTIYHLIHDFFYVKQSIEYKGLIDVSIAHSSFFSDAVFSEDPVHYANNLFHLPYGVIPRFGMERQKSTRALKLVFLGRLVESKGVQYLYEIEKKLKEKNVFTQWTIIGKGNMKTHLLKQWSNTINVSFLEPDSMDETLRILSLQDIFVFPTSFEGTPVSILESLSVGVVTIVNDLPGGIRDIVVPNIGFRSRLNSVDDFANIIETLDKDRDLLFRMQQSCIELSRNQYDITINADSYFKLFLRFDEFRKSSKYQFENKLNSILDSKYCPSILSKILRNLR
jgi:glycosyltransferase involved in cell wall biosynthesis